MTDELPPEPDGYAYFDFVGGEIDGEQRLIKLPIDVGFGYELIAFEQRYELLRDGRFHLMPRTS